MGEEENNRIKRDIERPKSLKKKVIGIIAVVIFCFLIYQVTIWVGEMPKNREIVQEIVEEVGYPHPRFYRTIASDTIFYDKGKDFTIRGKILIWDIGTPISSKTPAFFPSVLNSKIPKSLHADSSDSEITVFIVKPHLTTVMRYEDGASGYREDLAVMVVYWPSKEVAARFVICGGSPPSVKHGPGHRTGSEPYPVKIVDCIYAALGRTGEL